MRLGLTGAHGLLGWHFRTLLKATGAHDVRLATRATFESPARLKAFVCDLDAILHFAGMNRGPEQEVESTNVALGRALVEALKATSAKPRVVYSNSVHYDRNTGYGRGKRAAAEVIEAWAAESGTPFANIVLPHVFGECGKPFYNSVVSTFCYQLARNEVPRIVVNGELELLHAQVAARRCLQAAAEGESGTIRVRGVALNVESLLERLLLIHRAYCAQLVPDLREPLHVQLFNTYRSYLYPDHYPVALALHADARGSLFEAIKSSNGGQTFISTTRPGVTRGNHFHLRKMERFLVACGQAEIRVRRLFSEEVKVFTVSGEAPCYIDIPTLHAHSITNVGGSDLVTLFWTNEVYDPADSDTFPETVLGR